MLWNAVAVANVLWAHAVLGHGSKALVNKVGHWGCGASGGRIGAAWELQWDSPIGVWAACANQHKLGK